MVTSDAILATSSKRPDHGRHIELQSMVNVRVVPLPIPHNTNGQYCVSETSTGYWTPAVSRLRQCLNLQLDDHL